MSQFSMTFKFIVLFIVHYGLHYDSYSKYICSIYVNLVLRFSEQVFFWLLVVLHLWVMFSFILVKKIP